MICAGPVVFLKGKAIMNAGILEFIQSCVVRQRIRWTYHVNMRLRGRFIPREAILTSADCYEIIEEYGNDRYLPSYLIRSEYKQEAIHIPVAVDLKNDYATIVAAYKPLPEKRENDFRTGRK